MHKFCLLTTSQEDLATTAHEAEDSETKAFSCHIDERMLSSTFTESSLSLMVFLSNSSGGIPDSRKYWTFGHFFTDRPIQLKRCKIW